MPEDSNIVFSTAYLPPISYFRELNDHSRIYIDVFENYIKQTYRNRCCIYSANGKLSLSVPVKKVTGNHTIVKDIEIDYSEPWQRLHWRAIESAYSNSPFFLYYRDDFEPFYHKEIKFLIDLNHSLLSTIIKHLGIQTEFSLSKKYVEPNDQDEDYRDSFSPKKKNTIILKKYPQVFSDKHGFINDLSIIDLLFNEGKYAVDFMK